MNESGNLTSDSNAADLPATAPPAASDVTPEPIAVHRSKPAIPGYEILGELGHGGQAVVYKARHLGLNRLVAVKVVLAGAHASAELRSRFLAEAKAVARLRHPNIVQIYDVGEHDGRAYFSLEFMDGGSLAQKVRGQPQIPRDVAQFVETLAQAMQHAHELGIIHRDLKPANILLQFADCKLQIEEADQTMPGKSEIFNLQSAIPKITDFGLAKQLDAEHGQTQSGTVMGTASYMAAEQAEGRVRDIGPATDVYALGAILYELLTGRPPFRSVTVPDTLLQVIHEDPVAPARLQPNTPRDLETICLKCLQKEPVKRYPSAAELADDLRRFLHGEPIHARPVGCVERAWRWSRRKPAAAALALLLGILLGIGLPASSYFAWAFKETAEDATQKKLEVQQKAEQIRDQKLAADRLAYVALFRAAWEAYHRNQIGRTLELLDKLQPEHFDGIDLRGWEWHFLLRLCHSEITSLIGHVGEVSSVAWSPDGKLLASGGADGTVRLWDPAERKEIRCLRGHTGEVTQISFTPDGRRLVSASADTTVHLWDVATGDSLLVYQGQMDKVQCLAMSRISEFVASAGDDATIHLWDTKSGQTLRVLQGHEDSVSALAISPDGKLLVSTGMDDTTRIWDVATGRQQRVLEGTFSGKLRCVAFSPSGESVAVAGDGKKVHVFHVDTGKEAMVLAAHAGSVTSLGFSLDGRQLFSAGDSVIKVWDSTSGSELRTLRGHEGSIRSIAMDPNGKYLASASQDGTVRIWDPRPDQQCQSWSDSRRLPLGSMCFDHRGEQLVTGGTDMEIKVWNAKTGQVLRQMGRHEYKMREDRPDVISSIGTIEGHENVIESVAVSPDDRWIAAGDLAGALRVWNAATGEPLLVRRHSQPVFGVAVSRDGKLIASASWDDTIRLWSMPDGAEVRVLQGHEENAVAVDFSPDGRRLASAGWDRTVRIWDVASGKELTALRGHDGNVHTVCYSPDGRLIASGAHDSTLRLWDAATGKEVRSLFGHTGPVLRVVFSPDGRRLASGSADRTLKLWDVGTGQELLTLTDAHSGIVFSPDGRRLLANHSNTIKIWDAMPIDDQPFRRSLIAAARPVSTPTHPASTASPRARSGELKALGYYIASDLPDKTRSASDSVIRPPSPNQRFLIVALSVPSGPLLLSDAEYRALVEQAKQERDEKPPPPQKCMASFSPSRFYLSRSDGQKQQAHLIGAWPQCADLKNYKVGFSRGGFTRSSTNSLDPDERNCLTLAWLLDEHDCAPPFDVQLDNQKPVRVPEVRLQVPR